MCRRESGQRGLFAFKIHANTGMRFKQSYLHGLKGKKQLQSRGKRP